MIIKTRVFELINHKYNNLSELAHVMGISVSQIYRVKEGKRNINQKFIIGAIKAFPEYNLDDLFYLTPEPPTVKEKEPKDRTQQALEKFTSSINEYARHLKSHTSALTSLRQASQELREAAEKTNKVVNHLYRSLHN